MSGHVPVRLAKRLMQRRAIGVIEPVAWIERKEFQFGAFRQVRRLIHDKAPGGDASFDRHVRQRSITEPDGVRFVQDKRLRRETLASSMGARSAVTVSSTLSSGAFRGCWSLCVADHLAQFAHTCVADGAFALRHHELDLMQ